MEYSFFDITYHWQNMTYSYMFLLVAAGFLSAGAHFRKETTNIIGANIILWVFVEWNMHESYSFSLAMGWTIYSVMQYAVGVGLAMGLHKWGSRA